MFDRFDASFEPSSQTKEAMLYVRKRPLLIGGIRHPGLFGIHGFTVDWVAFLAALLLEGTGLVALYTSISQDGQAGGDDGSWFVPTLMIVLALLFVDLALALAHHRFATGINAKLEIESTLSSTGGGKENLIKVELNGDEIRRRKRISYALSILLLVVAAGKVVIYAGVAGGESGNEATVAFICVVYLGTAIIHITRTGYLMHAVWAAILHYQDVEKFKRSNGNECAAVPYMIELPSHPDFDRPLAIQHHEVVTETRPGSNEVIHRLKCTGMLFDREIEEFSNKILDAKARSDFVLKAMELQVRMI